MLKSVRKLVALDTDMKYGNHSVVHCEGYKIHSFQEYASCKHCRVFKFFGNPVCIVWDDLKKYHLDDCGYSHSPSTSRTLGSYKQYFSSIGYELDEGE